ncbi:natural cytotoxicity triggering receptor 3 ligand 1-like isoform X2 [Spea bombifrons]|uniref:natural cytotoxicity triggering receptor 3 ligand 1-like isoform X2 n=1 Tax=Spea bombifrons TaxID=233779 RepID=UPI002349EE9E|nr:natural cytotoxicity triggering receptor 3 ligand 1-like isoform X2 [Spea bombifrons]
MVEKRRKNVSLSVSAALVCSLLLMYIDAFRVTTNEPVIERLLGQDVKIPCFLSGYETPEVDLTYVSVQWIRKSPNGSALEVYRYELLRGHEIHRPGLNVSEEDIKKGDAGLYIPQVQVADDGEYTCIVFYTPDKGEASSTLHVSALSMT